MRDIQKQKKLAALLFGAMFLASTISAQAIQLFFIQL